MENDNIDSEDVIKNMRRKKVHTRLLTWNAAAFAVFAVLFGLMYTKAGLYRLLRHYEPHMVLQIILPVSVLLSLAGLVLLAVAGRNRVEKVKTPVALIQTLASLCGLAGYLINRQNIGGHMTDYEALAKSYLGIWVIAGIVSAVFMLLAAKEEI